MKDVFQVVFLIDLDCVSDCQASRPIIRQRIVTLTRVLLKFLTFYATRRCASTRPSSVSCSDRGDNTYSHLKWGYKYYFSSLKRPVRQQCAFREFSGQSFDQFENELEDKLLHRWSEVASEHQQQQCTMTLRSASVGAPTPALQSGSSCGRIPAEALEVALKELLIDYPWDMPHLISPVRWTRHHAQRSSKEIADLDTVRNVVIAVTGVPKSYNDLETFFGRAEKYISEKNKDKKITPTMILDTILPQTVRQKFCNVAKIQLIWLDMSEIKTVPMNQIQHAIADSGLAYRLVHQALAKIGGTIIPLDAVVPFQWCSEQSDTDGTITFRTDYPETLEFNIPFTSLMSGLSTNCHSQSNQQHQSFAHLYLPDGQKETLICNLELLPLFVQNSRLAEPFRTNSSNSSKFFMATTGTSPTHNKGQKTRQPIQDLHPIGTIFLRDVHSLLIAKPFVYMCLSNIKEPSAKENSEIFQSLLVELALKQMALVVTNGTVYQGILFPANRKCCAALLYILNYDDQFLKLTEKCKKSSTPDGTNKFVCQLLKSWETEVIQLSQSKTCAKPSHNKTTALSPAYLEKWFQINHCDKTLMKGIMLNSNYAAIFGEQQRLFQELQKTYIPLVPDKQQITAEQKCPDEMCRNGSNNAYQRKFNSTKDLSSESGSFLNNKYTSVGKKDTSIRLDSVEQCNSSLHQNAVKHKELDVELKSPSFKTEEDLISYLKNLYDSVLLSDGNLLPEAQTIVNSCLLFYKNLHSTKNSKVNARDVINKHLLLKSREIIGKHAGISESNKKIRSREHCLQSLIRLEILKLMPNDTQPFLKEIILHLRMLSFVAGPSMLASFLKESVADNYYKYCKEAVAEIYEDLNQPPLEGEGSPSSVSSSSSDFSPVKMMGSASPPLFSQMSVASTASSSSNRSKPSKLQRSDSIIRHPSFDLTQKRQITVPHRKARKEFRGMGYTGCVTRSAEKRMKESAEFEKTERKNMHHNFSKHGFPATKRHVTPSKQKRPTTPLGRHVLRTRKVAETPVFKQVAKAMLKKQSLKRKQLSGDDDGGDDVVVEESPDKQSGFVLRRSPRKHASSLQRQSFYSTSQASSKFVQDNQRIQQQDANNQRPYFSLTTPERQSRVKRHLNLEFISPNQGKLRRKTPQKENECVKVLDVRRSPRFMSHSNENVNRQEFPTCSDKNRINGRSPFKLCDNQTGQLLSPVFRKSSRISSSSISASNDSSYTHTEDYVTETFPLLHKTPKSTTGKKRMASNRKKGSPRKCRVARKLLQTPSKNLSDTLNDTPHENQKDELDFRIESTPSKNGLQSPEMPSLNTFTFGPLCDGFDSSSTSSSPRIPLLYDENIMFDYNEQENFDSLQFLNDAINSEPFDQCIDDSSTIANAFLSSSDLADHNSDVPIDNLPTSIDSFSVSSRNGYSNQQSFNPFKKMCHSKSNLLSSWSENDTVSATFELPSKQSHIIQNDADYVDKTFSEVSLREKTTTLREITKTSQKVNEVFLSGCPSQRFTRQSSKELGISLDIFKQLSVDSSNITDMTDDNYDVVSASFNQWRPCLKSASRTSVSNSTLTTPKTSSIVHLTTSPLVTQASRYSLRSKM